jgi:anti-sigma regulatory factor (Ser/Thr protein kinase)
VLKRTDDRGACGVFERGIAAMPALVRFTADAFARLAIDSRLLPRIDLAVEELFTNMVKYGRGSAAPIEVRLQAIDGGVELTLVDRDVEPFDLTRAPVVDIGRPIEEREPGGLGLHLVRRMADRVEYEYQAETRQSRIIVRFTSAGLAGDGRAAPARGKKAVD